MKVKFKGMKERKRGGGCGSCGHKSSGGSVVRTHKELSLPSQQFKMFRMNQITTVSESDGEWLLARYGDAFEKVD